MPLYVKDRGMVELKPQPPVMSRLWVPPTPRRPIDSDASRVQRALLASGAMSGARARGWLW